MSRRRITKAHREQLDRLNRGLLRLVDDIKEAKSPDTLISIADDVHGVVISLKNVADSIQRPQPTTG